MQRNYNFQLLDHHNSANLYITLLGTIGYNQAEPISEMHNVNTTL